MTSDNKGDAPKVEETRYVYNILQIMPAAPETFMLYKATEALWDDPTPRRPVYDTLVAGWALVEEWVVPQQSQYRDDDLPTYKPDRRTVVPLLMDSFGPRTPHGFRENDHVGFRIGKYVVFDGLAAIEKSMGPDMLLEPASQQGAAAGDGEAFAATMTALRRLAPTCFRCGALASLDGYMEETSSGLEKPQSVCVECAHAMTRTFPNDIHREITALRRLGHV